MQEAIINPAQTVSERTVNAVCVDVLDLGTVKSLWGERTPIVDLVFECDELDQYGKQRILDTRFRNRTHEMNPLTAAVKSWCGRTLWREEAIGNLDLKFLIGLQARLELLPAPSRCGGFDRIGKILPPGDVHVQSITYRKEQE